MSLAAPAAASSETVEKTLTYRGISIYLNGVRLAPADEKGQATEPFIMDDTSYLPLRAVASALGLSAQWIPGENTVALQSGGDTAPGGIPLQSRRSVRAGLTYRDISVSLDGEKLSLAAEPFILDGSTYLPLRALGEALGLSVEWDGASSSVFLLSEGLSLRRTSETLAADREGHEALSVRETFSVEYPDRVHTLTYESDGTKTESILYLDADGNPTEELFYNAEGELSASESWEWDGDYLHYRHDELADDSGDSYIRYYFRDGRLHSAREYGGSTLSKVHSTDHSYYFDDSGNLIRHYIRIPDASWEEILYSYDTEGRLLEMQGKYYDIHTNGFSRYYELYYYEDGLLVRSEGSYGVCRYFHAPDGSLLKTVFENSDGSFLITEYNNYF